MILYAASNFMRVGFLISRVFLCVNLSSPLLFVALISKRLCFSGSILLPHSPLHVHTRTEKLKMM
ncbi:hypothetical protein NC652_035812 [Populus alba x Populus x berolinensis]|nr:hypothetical protein NC652_035812 [Populus alba x Populus x berolinensis]